MAGNTFLRRRCGREAQVQIAMLGRERTQCPDGDKVLQAALSGQGVGWVAIKNVAACAGSDWGGSLFYP
jgi:hypothetical protein